MAKSALLDADPLSGRVTIYHEEDGKTFIESRQDCEHIIEAAKILATQPPDPETGLRFICAIPETVMNKAMTEGWFHDKDAWRRWAMDPDNRKLNGDRNLKL